MTFKPFRTNAKFSRIPLTRNANKKIRCCSSTIRQTSITSAAHTSLSQVIDVSYAPWQHIYGDYYRCAGKIRLADDVPLRDPNASSDASGGESKQHETSATNAITTAVNDAKE